MTKLPRRQFLHLAAGAAALLVVSRMAWAQAYPTRPITMVVPFAPGGAADVIARMIAEPMRASLGQPVIIENVTGAAGTIGVRRVAGATPDGYTLIAGTWNTHVANGALYSLQFDLQKDFEPIALISNNPWLIAVRKNFPAADLNGLIAWLKANPGKASAGTAGVGSPEHVSGVLFQNMTGTNFQFVSYRGGAPAMQDLIAGQIDMMIEAPATFLPQLNAGSVRAFAVTAKSRLAAAPDVPTVDEAGLPGFYFLNWLALWAPKGTPKNAIDKLNAAVVSGLIDSILRKRLAELGPEVFPRHQQTPAALAAFQKSEIEKWWPIIKAANIKGE